ncbi:hypothetical protein GCM10022217_37650 [Chryseobacterium ginsenosidimutans]
MISKKKSRMKAKVLFFTGLILLIVLFLYYKNDNPYENVIWKKDYPGATERYVEFTPYLKSKIEIKIGPTLGADLGKLRFEDIDSDGIKEAIIETKKGFTLETSITPERHILKFKKDKNGNPKFILLKSEILIE